MEQKLLQEAEGLGILDKDQGQQDAASVYIDALKRVEEEVKKAPKNVKVNTNEEEKKNGDDEDLEKYGDDLMN